MGDATLNVWLCNLCGIAMLVDPEKVLNEETPCGTCRTLGSLRAVGQIAVEPPATN